MRWAIYCYHLGGWLVDTSFAWSFDVDECQWFSTCKAAEVACCEMTNNGHEVFGSGRIVLFMRIR